MSSQEGTSGSIATQIAHVLFIDIIGYSKETISGQARLIGDLSSAVAGTSSYARAILSDQLIALPTGDGMAIAFFDDLASPARCAQELSKAITEGASIPLRMGIHSGPIQLQNDISGKRNVLGEGINTAQRVMDLGNEGQVLLSAQYAGWLQQFDEWSGSVQEFGEGVTKHGEKLKIYCLTSESSAVNQAVVSSPPGVGTKAEAIKVVVLYKRNAQPDIKLLATLERVFAQPTYAMFIDRHLKIGVEWARAIEERIRNADAVIALLSNAALGSEMLEYELEIATDEYLRRRRPFIMPIRIGATEPPTGPIGGLVNSFNFSFWNSPTDNARVVAEIVESLKQPPSASSAELAMEPAGGAVSSESPFYVVRDTDHEFTAGLKGRESILLVKGPRQMGKTSLIGKGTRLAKSAGLRSATTDFQKLSSAHFENGDACYRMMAASVARQLKFTYDFDAEWLPVFGSNMNLDNFIRTLIDHSEVPFVWFMDEVDRLFSAPFASDFFGLVRSWHNSRATEPDGPWERFTVAIAYATEAHLFIQDLNQSPFNVGRQINLKCFTLEEIQDLNDRYGSPLKGIDKLQQLHYLIDGQPFLTRRALECLVKSGGDLKGLIERAHLDDGPFGDHLKRVLVSVSQLEGVLSAMRANLANVVLEDSVDVQRLVSAGVLVKRSAGNYGVRCDVYQKYLSEHLQRGPS